MSSPSTASSPGSWGAWCVTLIASWIPLLQNDYAYDLHFITYALYTNWAALDGLIRRFGPKKGAGVDTEIQAVLMEQQGLAVGAIVFVGLLNAQIQLLTCIIEFQRSGDESKDSLERRFWTILIGMVLPACTCWIYP